ncbi:reverse transcriptase [Gossypium australe]|uniref:Reverse transcriptase n=1 Tax=Gossypium australe TaxID=47621 RepID=A0A5B6WT03_9ROSI|nr:reverse transcriptase [Gossypium australe]
MVVRANGEIESEEENKDEPEATTDEEEELEYAVDDEILDFEDVFPDEVPSGLSPIQRIEHQIDFMPGAIIPNRLAYCSNPEEAKELQ